MVRTARVKFRSINIYLFMILEGEKSTNYCHCDMKLIMRSKTTMFMIQSFYLRRDHFLFYVLNYIDIGSGTLLFFPVPYRSLRTYLEADAKRHTRYGSKESTLSKYSRILRKINCNVCVFFNAEENSSRFISSNYLFKISIDLISD